MEDLVRYLSEIVEPTIEDFEKEPTSLRHAFLACVATYHAVDYLTYPTKRPANLKQEWRKESRAFAIVDDVAHAFKHVIAGDKQNPRLKADRVVVRPPMYFDVSGAFDVSRFDDPIGGVMLDDMRNVDLLDALKRAAAFLREQIKTS
jgi:hypothetical protein